MVTLKDFIDTYNSFVIRFDDKVERKEALVKFLDKSDDFKHIKEKCLQFVNSKL